MFDRVLVTRVTRLEYKIRPKMAKIGAFLSSLETVTFLESETRKGYNFENRFLTWVPSLTTSGRTAVHVRIRILVVVVSLLQVAHGLL
jgi:hypothetical protein